MVGRKTFTPESHQGEYETYSTVPPCLRLRCAARVLCNGRSRPSLHIGGRLQGCSGPVGAKAACSQWRLPLFWLPRTASFSMPFFKFEDTISRRSVSVKGQFTCFGGFFQEQSVAGLMPGPGRCGRRLARGSALIFFVLTTKTARPVKKNCRRQTPLRAYLLKYGVVRIGPAEIDGPVDPAPSPAVETPSPHPMGGAWTGWSSICLYFYLRAFRFAGRCRGNC